MGKGYDVTVLQGKEGLGGCDITKGEGLKHKQITSHKRGGAKVINKLCHTKGVGLKSKTNYVIQKGRG